MEGLKIVVGNRFNLPRLGTDVFSALMKAGVDYEKGGGFIFTAETNLQTATRTIESATGERIELSVKCFVCLKESCPSCPFEATCDRCAVSPTCLCDEHSAAEDAFGTYSRNFEARLAE